MASFEDLNKNSEDTRIYNVEKECEEVEKFYTCEEKWYILQALQTTSPEIVCEKFSVKLDLLEQWKEDSAIIQRELIKNKRNLSSSDSSDEADSLPNPLVWENKEKILNDFEKMGKKQFYQKYYIHAYLIHMLILHKIQMIESSKKIHNNNPYKKLRTHDGFFDFNIKDALNSIFNLQELKNKYTHWEWTRLQIEIEKAQKLVKGLYDWFLQTQQRGIFIAEFMLRSEANQIARTVRYNQFLGTVAWLDLWYKICNINVRTINKSAEYFDRTFLFKHNNVDECSSQESIPEDETCIKEEIDNVEEDLYFWYDENIKAGKSITDTELCARAEKICMAFNDRPFLPDILWLFGWKRQYNIPCAELEWKIFKINRTQLRKSKNVMKHGKPPKQLRFDESSETQPSPSTSSTSSVSDQMSQVNIWRPF